MPSVFGKGQDLAVSLLKVRPATTANAAAMLAIYAPIVEATAISFELTPPTIAQFAERIRTTIRDLPWLVADDQGSVLGYAYANHHRVRGAYRWSVDTSVYVDPRSWRRGVATELYRVLLDELTVLGYVSAYAGIALPNDASVALHEKLGFMPIGRFPNVGFKNGAWHDVGWWHRPLRPSPASPPEPRRWGSG